MNTPPLIDSLAPTSPTIDFSRLNHEVQRFQNEFEVRVREGVAAWNSENGLEAFVNAERSLFRERLLDSESNPRRRDSVVRAWNRLPVQTFPFAPVELSLNEQRVAVASAVAGLIGCLVGLTILPWSSILGMVTLLCLVPACSYLTLRYCQKEFSSAWTTALIGAGIVTVGGVSAWQVANYWWNPLRSLLGTPGVVTPWMRWTRLALILIPLYALRIWVRAGGKPTSNVSWMKQSVETYRLLVLLDLVVFEQPRVDERSVAIVESAPDQLLIELFDRYQHRNAEHAELIEELFELSGLQAPNTTQKILPFDHQIQQRVKDQELELVGRVQAGDTLRWIRFPIIQQLGTDERRVIRKGRLEKIKRA